MLPVGKDWDVGAAMVRQAAAGYTFPQVGRGEMVEESCSRSVAGNSIPKTAVRAPQAKPVFSQT